jgi:hypothetical protein
MNDKGRRVDFLGGPFEVGVPVDIGWGVAVLNADDTVTRTCKGCGVSVTTAVVRSDGHFAKVTEAPIMHRFLCPVGDRLGNNPVWS